MRRGLLAGLLTVLAAALLLPASAWATWARPIDVSRVGRPIDFRAGKIQASFGP